MSSEQFHALSMVVRQTPLVSLSSGVVKDIAMRRKTSEREALILTDIDRPWSTEELRGRARWERIGMRVKVAIEWLLPQALWDTVIMGSHRDSLSVEQMHKLVVRFHARYMRGCPLVYGIELHPGGHGAHWHGCSQIGHRAQSGAERVFLRSQLWEKWFDGYGRASFWPPRSAQDVLGYALKDSLGEAIKDGDWGVLGFMPGTDKVKLGRAMERRSFRFRQGLEFQPAIDHDNCERVPVRSPAGLLSQIHLGVDLRASAS
jgi:hypothetical protein